MVSAQGGLEDTHPLNCETLEIDYSVSNGYSIFEAPVIPVRVSGGERHEKILWD